MPGQVIYATVEVGGSVTAAPSPPVTPATYVASATSLTGKSGATWLLGATYTLPTGLNSVSFSVDWTHGGPTSKLSYRIRVGHASDKMGVTRTRNSAPASIVGAVAYRDEYQEVVTPVEVGVDAVVPVVHENTDGYTVIALDVQQAVVDGAGDGTVGVTVAGSYA